MIIKINFTGDVNMSKKHKAPFFIWDHLRLQYLEQKLKNFTEIEKELSGIKKKILSDNQKNNDINNDITTLKILKNKIDDQINGKNNQSTTQKILSLDEIDKKKLGKYNLLAHKLLLNPKKLSKKIEKLLKNEEFIKIEAEFTSKTNEIEKMLRILDSVIRAKRKLVVKNNLSYIEVDELESKLENFKKKKQKKETVIDSYEEKIKKENVILKFFYNTLDKLPIKLSVILSRNRKELKKYLNENEQIAEKIEALKFLIKFKKSNVYNSENLIKNININNLKKLEQILKSLKIKFRSKFELDKLQIKHNNTTETSLSWNRFITDNDFSSNWNKIYKNSQKKQDLIGLFSPIAAPLVAIKGIFYLCAGLLKLPKSISKATKSSKKGYQPLPGISDSKSNQRKNLAYHWLSTGLASLAKSSYYLMRPAFLFIKIIRRTFIRKHDLISKKNIRTLKRDLQQDQVSQDSNGNSLKPTLIDLVDKITKKIKSKLNNKIRFGSASHAISKKENFMVDFNKFLKMIMDNKNCNTIIKNFIINHKRKHNNFFKHYPEEDSIDYYKDKLLSLETYKILMNNPKALVEILELQKQLIIEYIFSSNQAELKKLKVSLTPKVNLTDEHNKKKDVSYYHNKLNNYHNILQKIEKFERPKELRNAIDNCDGDENKLNEINYKLFVGYRGYHDAIRIKKMRKIINSLNVSKHGDLVNKLYNDVKTSNKEVTFANKKKKILKRLSYLYSVRGRGWGIGQDINEITNKIISSLQPENTKKEEIITIK
jgi:hypothetical protein